jgi:protein-L-isoaspartate(D-aspartate) O-methyltransferase
MIDSRVPTEAEWARQRREMVELLKRYGIQDARVLAAMAKVRRHAFIPVSHLQHGTAYGDHPLEIGYEQTISQPYIVAHMTEMLALQAGEKMLEIGAGSGYQAAVLAELGARVFTMEVVPELADHARGVLAQEGYDRSVRVLTGDGYKGWPEEQPFDAVIVTCAPENVPPALVKQLREGGRMVAPVGAWMNQRLVILRKRNGKIEKTDDVSVWFVPMVKGRAR